MGRKMKLGRQFYELWAVLNFFRNVILVYFCKHDDESMGYTSRGSTSRGSTSMGSTSPDIVFTK